MYYFILDLDDTLYQNETDRDYIDVNEGTECVDSAKIKELSELGKVILFSNANTPHCNKWLTYLGIIDYFSAIVNYDSFNMYKPNPNLYNKLIQNCGIRGDDTVFFFDDLPLNLFPGFKLGWKTALIKKNYKKDSLNLFNDSYIENVFNNVNNAIDYVLLFINPRNEDKQDVVLSFL